MSLPTPLITSQIDAADLLETFQSSDAAHAHFFRNSALAQDRAGLVRTHVLRTDEDDSLGEPNVLGYYSLAAGALTPSMRAGNQQPSPVIILERFSVHYKMEGSGIAKHLLMDAFVRCATTAAQIGAIGVLATAPSPRARSFCVLMDFVPMTQGIPCKLVIPMSKVREAVMTAFSFP